MFFDAQCIAPWCIRSPASRTIAAHVTSPANRVVEFHLLVAGSAFVRVEAETMQLSPGDIVMLPHGDRHEMGNGQGAVPIDGEAELPALLRGRLRSSRVGAGPGDVTRLVCGYLACDARIVAPLIASLPSLVRVNVRGDAYGELIEQMILHAVQQAAASTPGSAAVVGRMAEVLFTEVLRRHAQRSGEALTGWLAAAADPAVGRALAALHRRPGHSWTVEELAEEAGLSRSSLAERFTRSLGRSPMSYLFDWRMEIAAAGLRDGTRSVIDLATDLGYESESAFHRAFKRRFGEPPGRYRRQQRISPGDAGAAPRAQ